MINTFSKLEVEGSFRNMIKKIYNTLISIERLNTYPCKFSDETKMSILIHHSTGSFTNCKELKREVKAIQIERKK